MSPTPDAPPPDAPPSQGSPPGRLRDGPPPPAARSLDGRDETELQRLDRQWNELLQELRVSQTGVQILFAFLLTLPFTQRFASVTSFQRGVYVVTLLLAAFASALLIGPVAYHRLVFRKRVRSRLVAAGNAMAIAGLALLGLAINGVVLLIADVLFGPLATALMTAGTTAVFVTLWWVLPLSRRLGHGRRDERPHGRHHCGRNLPAGVPPDGDDGTGGRRGADRCH
ncbi:MAG TPA: DUF6328 family protein [Frankiaceae bacterium]|nr:DUF6328 family protein [Frankiaceae bacterium]